MFVSVKFREGDVKTYTYQSDVPYFAGDHVLVDVKGEQKVVIVDQIDLPQPKFECKPILGMAPEKPAPTAPVDGDDLL